jgi:hypothetical protein
MNQTHGQTFATLASDLSALSATQTFFSGFRLTLRHPSEKKEKRRIWFFLFGRTHRPLRRNDDPVQFSNTISFAYTLQFV